VGDQCTQHADDDPETVPNPKPGHELIKANKAFVMHEHGRGDNRNINKGDGQHDALPVRKSGRNGGGCLRQECLGGFATTSNVELDDRKRLTPALLIQINTAQYDARTLSVG
jgi:hypothetical protein